MVLVYKYGTQSLPIKQSDEEKLWTSSVMDVSTPKSLQNTPFFIAGKMFSLRGGVEHGKLKLTQIQRHHDPDQ